MSVKHPHSPDFTGRGLGLLWVLVLALPILLAVLALTTFSLLDDDDPPGVTATTTSAVTTAEPGATPETEAGPVPAASAPDQPATPEPPLDEPETTAEQVYRVVAGDTLAAIAARVGVTVAAMVAFNAIENPNALRLGQELRIPPADFQPPPPPDPDADEPPLLLE